ncbi:DUF2484 family protein [Roseicyclus sp. F158]|uniref:DUF2484 family protein n=1 Tax=Tropicimonas omnivorans TaxID=3075590 RepID=A0ABU3DGK2_9RHOB|nr:DUF2484 family protein [Roseicyclus sp. F158]MDT0682815.1 DUF2484 family protein [Roseicyclus sp. F158]
MAGAALLAGFLWMLASQVAGMLPSRRRHWPAALILVATGIPLLGWITLETGPLFGLLFLLAGISVLRWPLYFAGRWTASRVAGHKGDAGAGGE